MNRRTIICLAALCALASAPGWACSSCGCTLGTDWVAEGYSANAGLRLDLRYDYIYQSELRHGSHAAGAQDIQSALAGGSAMEVQRDSVTRFYTLGLDYSFNHDWGVNLQLPYLRRTHSTLMDGDSDASFSRKSGVGDARVVARYQGLIADRSLGLQLGLKLPTGAFDQRFSEGPAAGEPLDRGLQLGTGTTDLIAGVYRFRAFSRNWDHFEQAQVKLPLYAREEFRPGAQAFANFGVRYVGFMRAVPQLQLNLKWEGRESGAQADRPNSGSAEIYLSPGLSVSAARALALYGFVQLPVYRDYHGLQLAPKYTLTAGLRYAF